jgi:chromosome segregation ATPase
MRITTKIEMMKNLLAQMPPEDQSPSKYKLMAQIHRLEGRLIRWDAWIEKKGKKADQKRCKKWDKHEKKQEKKLDHLSPEALQQYQLLKAQIASLKPTLYELKSAKKAKKAQLEVALQQGSGDKETIWQEILVLKERIAEVKKEIKPLKDNIKALKEKK